ncbi:hypothetical protein RJ640_024371 [Escallonia rubra]|uniref:Uncharacterized protein n=1 Tax=Escallonia rubra TaxID=112253 RepID=A0AA88RVI1_9ASTE|nr:hypothetical protein RJ640_024371 [Escallonia rubra]
MSLGIRGIRNNWRPLDNEEPRDYANRSAIQWNGVSIYPKRLGDVSMKHVVHGSILYLEGNLETKIFIDPITSFVRRIREIALQGNSRLLFLGNGSEAQPMQPPSKGVDDMDNDMRTLDISETPKDNAKEIVLGEQ